MNHTRRNVIILGVLVLAVILIFWARRDRDETVLVYETTDTVETMTDGTDGNGDAVETGGVTGDAVPASAARTGMSSLCDDLVLSDSLEDRTLKGWHTRGVSIYEGEPQLNRRVARSAGNDSTYWMWKLPGSSAGYWIECNYEGNRVRSRRLPDEVNECTVALDGSSKMPLIRGVACSD